jgi:hypothetical protein
VRAKGIICRNILNLSLHQPQALSAPPLLTIAFPYRSVSTGSAVATDNENDSLCLKAGFPSRVRSKCCELCENIEAAQSSMRGPQER